MDTLNPDQSPVRVIDATANTENDGPLIIPGDGWLMDADFVRQGPDLLLIGEDGQQILITDYFSQSSPPDLQSAGGGTLPADLVAKLAGPLAPGQFAGTEIAQATQAIGQVDTISGTVEATRPDGTKVTLSQGGKIFSGDVVETGDNGAVAFVMADDSTLSLGKSGRMLMDEMVYDPAEQSGNMKVEVVKGILSFVSGQIAKTDPDAMVLTTPVATLGIRGTTGVLSLPDGESLTVVLSTNSDGTLGEITVTNGAGTQVLNQPFQATAVAGFNLPPSGTFTLTAAQFNQQYSGVVQAAQAAESRAAQTNQTNGNNPGEGAPGEGDAPPGDGETPPEDGEAPPGEGEAPPQEGEAPPEEGAPEDELPPEEAPPEGDVPPDGEQLADGETPPEDGPGPDGPGPDGPGPDGPGPDGPGPDGPGPDGPGPDGPGPDGPGPDGPGPDGPGPDGPGPGGLGQNGPGPIGAGGNIFGGGGGDIFGGGGGVFGGGGDVFGGGGDIFGGGGGDILDNPLLGGSGDGDLLGLGGGEGDGDFLGFGGEGDEVFVGPEVDDFNDSIQQGEIADTPQTIQLTSVDNFPLIGGTAADTFVLNQTAGAFGGSDLIDGLEGFDALDLLNIHSALFRYDASADIIEYQVYGGTGVNDIQMINIEELFIAADGQDLSSLNITDDDLTINSNGVAITFDAADSSRFAYIMVDDNIGTGNTLDLSGAYSGYGALSGDTATDNSPDSAIGSIVFGLGGDDNMTGTNGGDILIGGVGNDTFNDIGNLDTTEGDTFIGGSGTDTVLANAATSELELYQIEQVTGSNSDNNLTIENTQSGTTIDLQGGTGDTLNLATGTSSLSISNVENLNGTNLDNTITITNQQTSLTIDLLDGTDVLNFTSTSGNVVTVSNAETITTASTANDTITLGAVTSPVTVNLGSATNTLNITESVTLSLTDVDLLNFNNSAQASVTLATSSSGLSVTGSSRTDDVLTLANGGNTITVTNTETITGGTSTDTLTYTGAVDFSGVTLSSIDAINFDTGASGVTALTIDNTTSLGTVTITGTSGDDTITLASGGVTADLTNVTLNTIDTIEGGAGGDTITGTAGSDEINGNGGNDTLNGGGGADTLTGNAGSDTFVANSGGAIDTITDFTGADDSISLDLEAGQFSYSGHSNTLRINGTGQGFTFSADTGIDEVEFNETVVNGGGMIISELNNSGAVTGSTDGDFIFVGDSTSGQIINGNDGDDRIFDLSENANTLQGGAGEDRILGGSGADNIDVGSGDGVRDRVFLRHVYDGGDVGASAGSFSGHDSVTNFVGKIDGGTTGSGGTSDRIQFTNSGTGTLLGLLDRDEDGTLTNEKVVLVAAGGADTADLSTDSIFIIEDTSVSSLTDVDAVVTAINAAASLTNNAIGDRAIFVVRNSTDSGVYLFTGKNVDNTVIAEELAMLATVNSKLSGADLAGFAGSTSSSSGATTVTGTASAETISSASGGNDTLTGNGGIDTFTNAVGGGHDTITDFTIGTDLLNLDQAASEFNYHVYNNQLTFEGSGFGPEYGFFFEAGEGMDDVNFDVTNQNAAGGKFMSMTNGTGGLTGSTSNDLLVVAGTTSGETIDGSSGDDRIIDLSGYGNILTAGVGADIVIGGAGADIINLGEDDSDVDTVVFRHTDDGGAAGSGGTFAAGDTITNFNTGQDLIKFSGNGSDTFLGLLERANDGALTGTSVNVTGGTAIDIDSQTIFMITGDLTGETAASLTTTSNVIAAINTAVGTFNSPYLGDNAIFAVENTAQDTTGIYVYTEDDGDGTIHERNLQLLGTVDSIDLTSANFVGVTDFVDVDQNILR